MSTAAPSVAGLAELCAMAGVSKSTAAGWLRRGAPRRMAPLPDWTDLASGPVWDREALQRWALQYRLTKDEPVDD